MDEERPLLDIVIVAHRCRELLAACLQSLEEHPLAAGTTAIHVIDNASDDGTVELLCERFARVAVSALATNAGFAAAANIGLHAARAPFVLLLNPDTRMTAGALDGALDALRDHPAAGMLGCRLVRPDGSFDHAAKRSFPTPLAALAHFTGLGGRPGAGPRLAQYRAPRVGERAAGDVDAVNGAFMLVRREAIDDVGPLDEGYWLYMEDLDWCRRFRQRGWRIRYDGRATVVHVKGGSSAGRRGVRQELAFHRGMGRFYRRYHGHERSLLALVVYGAIAAKLAIALGRGALVRARQGQGT